MTLRGLGQFVCLLLCSCATDNPVRSRLPATVTMNKDAGRGDFLIVMLRLESGEKLPFVVDTGCPATGLDKSLEPKLGKRLGTIPAWNFGVEHEANIYAAPKLYLGNSLLVISGTNIVTYDCKQLPSEEARPIMGILGMDVLEHYCIQLDFKKGKIRFLDDERAKKKNWGKPFPLTATENGCFAADENLIGAKGQGSLIDTGNNSDGWLTPNLFQRWTNHAVPPANGETRSPDGLLGGGAYRDLDLFAVDNSEPVLSGKFNGIGLGVLSESLVTLDFPKRTMYLKRMSDGPLVPNGAVAAANSAFTFLTRLKKKGQLPGWSKDDKGWGTGFEPDYSAMNSLRFVNSVIWDMQKTGDSSIYHYTFCRAFKESPWKLQKAWRTNQSSQTNEEYPLP